MIDYKKYVDFIAYIADAHQEKTLPTARKLRTFPSGEKNPYFTHSLWCSTMVLLDTQLPESIRDNASIALLFHDIFEDTSAPLPDSLTPEIIDLIKNMTYANFQEEVTEVLKKEGIVHLVKLYDKVATLYDGTLRSFRYPEWLDFTEQLIVLVEKAYGELNIVLLGKSLTQKYRNKLETKTIPKLPSEIKDIAI